jgi:hypothetical protein
MKKLLVPAKSRIDLLAVPGDAFDLAPLDVPALDVINAHVEDVTCGGIHSFEPVFPYKDIQGEIRFTRLAKMEDQQRAVSFDEALTCREPWILDELGDAPVLATFDATFCASVSQRECQRHD